MRKMSGFYLAQHKRVNYLTKEIQMIEMQSQIRKEQKLTKQRKSKCKELSGRQNLKLPKFNHIKKQYAEFSLLSPNSSEQPFVSEKAKRKLSSTDRVYSSLPNMKIGKLLVQRKSEIDNPIIKNRKFIEFQRITDQQSALHRISAKKLKQYFIIHNKDPQGSVNLGKTYFQKFTTHKYNFYDSNNSISRNSLISKSKTQRPNRSILQLQKSRLDDSTLSSLRQSENFSLNCRSLNKSKIKKTKLEKFETFRSKLTQKIKTKTSCHQKLAPITLQKNINSLEYSNYLFEHSAIEFYNQFNDKIDCQYACIDNHLD